MSCRTEFAILGAGAIGSILGAHLARAGHSVTMLVRERRAAQLHDGLRIKGLAEFTIPVQVLTDASQLRGADVLFYSYERLPKGQAIPKMMHERAPDLVVEVKSPSDNWTELFGKVVEYLRAGVRVVLLLDPESASASVYRPDELQRILHNSDELTLPEVLPNFAVPVSRLFA